MPQHIDSESFWQFCLYHYSQAGVQPACLAFQDHYQGNVNLALLLHWLDQHQLALAPPHGYKALLAALTETDTLLTPYRVLRKQLKPNITHEQYQQMLSFELLLERRQQHHLLTCLNQYPLSAHACPNNLVTYGRHLDAPLSLIRQLQAIT
ncbi:TIGR02444 family protein [Photobacterium minamisatsumaniensis]|uniref:TIGR02444 family protein n=1 Tax=Photobacterium minamisatsumaniensis TaxID=2910233 RepID=UPI003D1465EE